MWEVKRQEKSAYCKCHSPLWFHGDCRAYPPPTHTHTTHPHRHPCTSPGITPTRLQLWVCNPLVLSPWHRDFLSTDAWLQCLCLPLLVILCYYMVLLTLETTQASPKGLIFPCLSRRVLSDLAMLDKLVERTGSVAPSVHMAAPFLCVLVVQSPGWLRICLGLW